MKLLTQILTYALAIVLAVFIRNGIQWAFAQNIIVVDNDRLEENEEWMMVEWEDQADPDDDIDLADDDSVDPFIVENMNDTDEMSDEDRQMRETWVVTTTTTVAMDDMDSDDDDDDDSDEDSNAWALPTVPQTLPNTGASL